MSYNVWEGIAETPWWFYVSFTYFMYIAYLASKPRSINIRSYSLAYTFNIFLLTLGLSYIAKFNRENVCLIIGSITAGILLGWVHFHYRRIDISANKKQMGVQGSWILFILLPALLIFKYYFYGYSFTLDPSLLKQQKYVVYFDILIGLSIGVFIGRMTKLFQRMRRSTNH